jgi:hypothetical protein
VLSEQRLLLYTTLKENVYYAVKPGFLTKTDYILSFKGRRNEEG